MAPTIVIGKPTKGFYAETVDGFQKTLKTHLFNPAFI